MNQYVCRCCLKENPELPYEIFDISTSLLRELQECSPTSVKYEYNDGLPQIICDLCWIRVQEANDFRRQCLVADQELRNRYADYKNKAVEEVLGLIEKFRQQDNEVLGMMPHNQFSDDLYQDFEETRDLPDFNSFELPYATNSFTNDLDFYNTSHDSGIFEDDLNFPRFENFENILTPEASKESSTDNQNNSNSLETAQPTPPLPVKTTKDRFTCIHCNKKFTRNFQLRLHLISIHNIGDGPQYICKICNKTFASRHSLTYHQKSIHYKEKPHACPECDREFTLKSQLVSHMRMHTGELKPRIFECKECGKKWPTKSDLRTHMRTHDPNIERPFPCDKCEKRFFTRGHLTSHLLVHTGEKPFLCEYCNLSYQSVGNLNNHLLRRHAKEIMNKEECSNNENKGEKFDVIKDGINGGETVLMDL